MISSFSPVFPFESSLSFIKNIFNPDVRPIFETLLLRLELSFSGEWRKLRKLPFWLSYYFALYLDKMMVVMMMIFVNWIKQKRSLNRSWSTIWIFQIKMLEFTFEDSDKPFGDHFHPIFPSAIIWKSGIREEYITFLSH